MDHRRDTALAQFLASVCQRASQLAASAPIGEEQRTLLQALIEYYCQQIGGKSFSDPLAFFYLVVRVEADQLGEQPAWLGLARKGPFTDLAADGVTLREYTGLQFDPAGTVSAPLRSARTVIRPTA